MRRGLEQHNPLQLENAEVLDSVRELSTSLNVSIGRFFTTVFVTDRVF